MARRRNRRRNRRRVVRRGRGLRRAFNGGLVRGRMHPPTNSASPWNSYVMTFLWKPTPGTKDSAFKSIQCVGLSDIQNNLRSELGLSGVSVDMRIFRVDIWTQPPESNTDRNCVVFSPSDWTTGDECTGWAQINWYESWGTAVQPAHCHYIWPRSISNVVLPKQDTPTIFRLDCKDEKVKLIVKVHLAWRPSDPDPYRVSGIVTSLRTRVRNPPVEEPDGFETIGIGDMAISPIASGCCGVVSPP